jgi:hypothetical protein
MRGGHRLRATYAATTLRLRDGRRQICDGPYVEGEVQLGGYFIIEVAHLDVALDWAARCPAAAAGVVEIRPVLG